MFIYGTSPLSFLFFMLFFMPVIVRVLAAVGNALTAGPTATAQRVMPAQNSVEAFEAAKREFPSRMLDLDNELQLAEEFGVDLDADELKSARSHLNKAFATYSKTFGASSLDAPVNVTQSRNAIEKHLAAATRHLGLADPNSPLHNEPEIAEPVAKMETPEDELYRRFGVVRGDYADAPVAPRVQPTTRRSSVVMTPFGLMIGF